MAGWLSESIRRKNAEKLPKKNKEGTSRVTSGDGTNYALISATYACGCY